VTARLNVVRIEGGDGLPLVLVHGFLGSSADWMPVVDAMSRDRCFLLPDLPGHGRSLHLDDAMYTYEGAAAELAKTIREMHPKGCAMLGYSLGGRLALGVALQAPDTILRLIVESATAGLRTEEDRRVRKELDAERAAALRDQPLSDFVYTWYRQALFGPLSREPGRFEAMKASRSKNHPEELARALEGMSPSRQPNLWERLEELPMPAVFISGEDDIRYSVVARQMAGLCPQGKVVIVPNTGHIVHVEQRKQFIEEINRALEE
jgi:2-succinyl-6-hydroxy-2,4-cyclohexadiene-1-carboxylate synthase